MSMYTDHMLGLLLLTALAGTAQANEAPAIEIATRARALQPGELIVVVLSVADAADANVKAFNRTVPAFQTGTDRWEALVGIDLDQRPGPYTITADANVGTAMATGSRQITVVSKRFPSRTLTVDPNFVNPPPAARDRIARDAAFLDQVYAHPAPELLWQAPFVRPVPQAANSQFGTRSVFNGERRSPHAGADFMSPAGTPIKAPNAGMIVAARDLYFTGNTVIIDHGLGLFSMLAHLSEIQVREGEQILAGQTIGLVGATGRVTGAHLHWALRVGGARIDPLSALALLGADDPPPLPDAATRVPPR